MWHSQGRCKWLLSGLTRKRKGQLCSTRRRGGNEGSGASELSFEGKGELLRHSQSTNRGFFLDSLGEGEGQRQ